MTSNSITIFCKVNLLTWHVCWFFRTTKTHHEFLSNPWNNPIKSSIWIKSHWINPIKSAIWIQFLEKIPLNLNPFFIMKNPKSHQIIIKSMNKSHQISHLNPIPRKNPIESESIFYHEKSQIPSNHHQIHEQIPSNQPSESIFYHHEKSHQIIPSSKSHWIWIHFLSWEIPWNHPIKSPLESSH